MKASFQLFKPLTKTIPGFNDTKKETFGKHCEKRRKCLLPAFSPFPTMFSTPPVKPSLSLQLRML